MKCYQLWKLGFSDMKGVTVPRTRASPRRRIWISVVVIFIIITVLWAYLYPPQDYSYPVRDWFPSEPTRELTDAETAARVVFRQILSTPPFISRNPKIAFMFMTPSQLPFEKLWELFFKGHEGRYTIYVHASREKPEHVSPIFVGRDIHSEKVGWGMITMIDAERRLLAKALEDIDNQHFVLLSESCVPLHNFDYVYDFLMGSRHSFLDCFNDPGPHGVYRYSKNMLPEVRESEFRKGSQWFSMKRQHAMVVIADSLYYTKFRLYCRPGMEEGRNCYADEHYLPTLFHMMDPAGIANWSVTYVDWSEGKWHPRSFRAKDVTYERLKNMTSIDVSIHITSDEKKELLQRPCLWNGLKRPCYLFARKFYPEAFDNLVNLFSNYTIF
ncbi:glycosyltransferase BC10-like [Panicum virgatum]|uniref:Core-2/I-branching beta-1,6-N-acetylglucosaminyltransferase family protein n=1 Tax=Panicum virgatum TaxID=38727 RepID=A0A8T0RAF3_PANVG|nr:glycosyltransferase BC10-like [Panicum virgatum]KAG2582474.1 hypothetical protein PVAP13_6KG412000 [Panicum virgatum]